MSPSEEFVMGSLQCVVGGSYSDGEDPPDAILQLKSDKIGVEVSTLVQRITGDCGVTVSRHSVDAPAINFANDLNEEMSSVIPDDRFVLIIVPTPINDVRNTKEQTRLEILNRLQFGVTEGDIQICGNTISVHIYEGIRLSRKKVIGAVTTRNSSADIRLNAKTTLRERIEAKSKKWTQRRDLNGYWLALFNDYWLADFKTYELAYKELGLEHPFDRIYIINGGGDCHLLNNET